MRVLGFGERIIVHTPHIPNIHAAIQGGDLVERLQVRDGPVWLWEMQDFVRFVGVGADQGVGGWV